MTEEQKTIINKPIFRPFFGGAVVLVPPMEWDINNKKVPCTAYLAVNETKPTGSGKPVQARVLTKNALAELKRVLNSSDYDLLFSLMPEDISSVPEELLS